MDQNNLKIVFFGSSKFSEYVLNELVTSGFEPILNITNARAPIDLEKLKALNPDIFIVASFGKILPAELIYLPKGKTLNVHPSLLPKLRGPAPIQGAILTEDKTGVTIIRMDEKMDHGPIVAMREVGISPWPDHYAIVEQKLGIEGGRLLSEIISKWVKGEIEERPQDESAATYTKLIKKEDGLIDLNADPEENLRKVYAYSSWPAAYINFQGRTGEKRVVIKDAKIVDGNFIPTRVVPAGKKEMEWEAFLRGNA
jgi:methionyl-tRNA formyltransferase